MTQSRKSDAINPLERAGRLLLAVDKATEKANEAIQMRTQAEEELTEFVRDEMGYSWVSNDQEAREQVRDDLADYVLTDLLGRGGGGLQ